MKVGDRVKFKYTGNKKYDNKFATIVEFLNENIVMVSIAGVRTTAFISQLDILTKEDINEWRERKANGEFRRSRFRTSSGEDDESE